MSNGTLTADYSAGDSLSPAPTATASAARRVHRFLNYAILIGVPLQFYAAGLAVFGASSFAMHAMLGQAMVPLALLSFVASLIARRAGASAWRSLTLLLLLALQPILAFAPRASAPALSALHPAVGLLIAVVAWQIERRIRK